MMPSEGEDVKNYSSRDTIQIFQVNREKEASIMLRTAYHYPAFFFNPNGISIEFPNLPGCLPCAHTEDEAFHNAREALGLHLYGMEKNGDEIPAPTPLSQLHPEDGAVSTMVDVLA